MASPFHPQLACAEERFISSLLQGPEAVQAFYLFWSGLQANFSKAVQEERVDKDTLELAHQVVPRVEIITKQFLELHQGAESLALSLHDGLDATFANLDLGAQLSPSRKPGDTVRQLADESAASLPPYIELAYTWLLNHLHNPYPSKDVKLSIVRDARCSFKDIDNWFINVRKRIGWNELRIKHYENKRSKIVEAAIHFFKEVPQMSHHGPYTTHISDIGSVANNHLEFKSIESHARELFSNKLFDTPLATRLDDAVRHSMPETKTRAHTEEKHRRQVAKSRRGKDLQRPSPYPSPERSPERSPEPSPEQLPEIYSPPSIPDATRTTSRKRRNSDRDSPELEVEDRCAEPQKRSRLDFYQISHDLAIASLPSPAASLSDIPRDSSATPSDQTPSGNDCIIPTPPIPAAPSGKRKRRLSDAGNDGPSKRPHNALAVPRLQTVSDPLPSASPIITELYKTLFGKAINDNIPEPVSVEFLDDTQVEVDIYNYNASPDTVQPFWLANSSSGPCPTAPSLPLDGSSELPSLDKSQALDPSFDFLLFENYLKGLDIPQASVDISFLPDIPSHDHSSLLSFESMPPTQPPQEDVLSDPLSYFQIPGLSWDFQGNDDIFSATAPSAGILVSSNDVPPQVNPIQNDKEAKLKQIEALRAQLQNLEAEL